MTMPELRPNTANRLNMIIVTKTVLKRIYSLISIKQIKPLKPILLYSKSDILLIINSDF